MQVAEIHNTDSHLHKVGIFGKVNSHLIAKYHVSLVIRQSFTFQNSSKNLDLSNKTDLDI